MKALFDLSSAQPGTGFHGGGEYAKAVFFKLCELLPQNISLEVFYDPHNDIEKSILDACKTKNIKINLCINNTEISKILLDNNYDVFYTALPYSYFDLIIPSKTKFIYTIHGLRSLEYSMDKYALKYHKNNIKSIIKYLIFMFFPRFWKKHKTKKDVAIFNRLFSLSKNQTIITISDHSRYAIAYFFPQLDTSQIKILYSPLKPCSFDTGQNSTIFNSLSIEPNKYILLISGERIEKGAYRACRVLYMLMREEGRIPNDIKVLILGVSREYHYRKLTKNDPRFILHNYVSTEDLETIYKNAYLFMYPTLNEGFGYPPLEAMKYGVLCACSANSAITEVYGDSVLYFNPYDETEMGIRILQNFDENIRREKLQKTAARYQLIREKQELDLELLIKEIIS